MRAHHSATEFVADGTDIGELGDTGEVGVLREPM
jgi:hypothetical protein